MAGGGHHHQPVRLDPAIERWNYMRENVYQTFRFTRRATRHIVVLGALVPASIALIAYTFDNKFDWAGKQRGTSLISGSPARAPAAAVADADSE